MLKIEEPLVLVDTTVWVDYLNQVQNAHTVWLDHALDNQRIGLIDLILCEVLQGVRGEALFAQTQYEMSMFKVFSTGGSELAIASARNYMTLRARGITVRKTIDCIIATYCITHGHHLLHHDRDFDAFEEHLGLMVVHPSLPQL